MSTVAARRVEVLRPFRLMSDGPALFIRSIFDPFFRVLRAVWPILKMRKLVIVTRNDDVREVVLNHADFHVEQTVRMNLLMAGEPFMLGLDDRDAFKRSVFPLRQAVRPRDVTGLAQMCSKRAAELIAQAKGQLEVVDFVRQVTLDVFSRYIGVPQPAHDDLRIMVTRFYEFQVLPTKDPELAREAKRLAKALRDHIDGLIVEARKRGPANGSVLDRLLRHADGHPGEMSDAEIRTNLIGLLVGALPQLPIAAPQALDQLLSRPDELAAAAASARADDDDALARYVSEALRFDPMAPFLLRHCVRDREIALGSFRHTTIRQGDTVAVALLSAMKDPRRVADPERFDPDRSWDATYLHYGLGLHTCFFENINPVLIPAILKPLIACKGLTRARGRRGRLLKRGWLFTDQLWVRFTPSVRARSASGTPQPAPA